MRGFLLLLYSFPFFSFSLRKRKQATSAAGQRLAHLLFSALFPLLPPPLSLPLFPVHRSLSLSPHQCRHRRPRRGQRSRGLQDHPRLLRTQRQLLRAGRPGEEGGADGEVLLKRPLLSVFLFPVLFPAACFSPVSSRGREGGGNGCPYPCKKNKLRFCRRRFSPVSSLFSVSLSPFPFHFALLRKKRESWDRSSFPLFFTDSHPPDRDVSEDSRFPPFQRARERKRRKTAGAS